jgi:hypothetical protein
VVQEEQEQEGLVLLLTQEEVAEEHKEVEGMEL